MESIVHILYYLNKNKEYFTFVLEKDNVRGMQLRDLFKMKI